MATKLIDLEKSVYALSKEYPELVDVLKKIGFTEIANPGMLTSVGRFMTLPKGATLKNLDIETIKAELTERGYTIKE